jgi:hypothetical protein
MTATAQDYPGDGRIGTRKDVRSPLGEANEAARAVVRPEALSYHRLKPREVGPADVPLIGEAYRCWSDVWKQAFHELENTRELPSDDFTRQDEVGALFHGYQCIALSFFRWIDLSSPIDQDDSYFSVWPSGAREAACAQGSKICISSHFTIAAPWRRARGCSLKDVLAGLVVERFLVSDADAMVGTMRNDRGMNAMVYRSGFKPILENVIHHGVEVDLTAFFRNSCVRIPTSAVDEAIVQALRPHRDVARETA